MPNNSFYEIAVEAVGKGKKSADSQKKLIDALTEEAPILQSMPMEESTHDYHHVYEELVKVTAPDIVDLDAPLPIIDSETQVGRTSLTKIGGKIFAGQDQIKPFEGLQRYLDKRVPPSLRQAGMDMEYNLYYNRFLAAALRLGNVQSATENPSGNVYSSLVAVTWAPGEVTGLYSPLDYGDGKVFQTGMLYGGNLCENEDGVQGYKAYVQTMLGVLLENPKRIGAIVNIGNTPPSDLMIGELLDSVRSNGSTRLYCHRRLMRRIGNEYAKLTSKHEFVMLDKTMSTLSFNEVPFVGSFNVQYGTEAAILL